MNEGTRKIFRENIDKSSDAVVARDGAAADRLLQNLTSSMLYGCGAASTLFLGENTTAADHAKFGPDIKRQCQELRDQIQRKAPQVEQTRHVLEGLVTQALIPGHRRGRDVAAPVEDLQIIER